MPLEPNPSARFQLRGIGDLQHPAKCLACGSGTCQSGYMDLDTYYDYEGQQYLCMSCLTEAAGYAGLYTPEEVLILERNAAEIAKQLTSAKKELEDANQRLAAFDTIVRFNVSPPIRGGDISSSIATDAAEASDADGSTSSESISGSVGREPESKEPIEGGSGPDGSAQPKRRNVKIKSGVTL